MTRGVDHGEAAVRASIQAAVIGAVLTILYMIAYYRLLGVVAAVALLVYGLLSYAALLAIGDAGQHDQAVILQPGSTDAPLFLVHPVGGDVLCRQGTNVLAGRTQLFARGDSPPRCGPAG